MANETHTEIEVVVIVDEDGSYELGNSIEQAREMYNDNIGGDGAHHVITMKLKVPLPKPIVVSATLPQNDAGEYRLELTA
jgi:hypothetical protein